MCWCRGSGAPGKSWSPGLFGLFFRELLEQGPVLLAMLFGTGWAQEHLPAGQLNLGTLNILMPLLLLVGLGFSWFLLQRLLQQQPGSAGGWMSARLLLLTLGVFLLWLV